MIRCKFCHKDVTPEDYNAHLAEHTKLRPDGQMVEHITLPPEQRAQQSLQGVPRSYIHSRCGKGTGMPEEIIRSYLKNPFLYSDQTFCTGCGTCVPHSECRWVETNESLTTYFKRLKDGFKGGAINDETLAMPGGISHNWPAETACRVQSTLASDPAKVRLSDAKLYQLEGETFHPARSKLSEKDRELARARIDDQLQRGDSRSAVVLSVNPPLIAAYTDEMDCVAVLSFPRDMAGLHQLAPGMRLLAVNVYSRQKPLAHDLREGEGSYHRYGNFSPLIAEFLSDDVERIEARKAQIAEEEWARTLQLGREWVAAGIKPRDGRPTRVSKPADDGRPIAKPVASPTPPPLAAARAAVPLPSPHVSSGHPATAPITSASPLGPNSFNQFGWVALACGLAGCMAAFVLGVPALALLCAMGGIATGIATRIFDFKQPSRREKELAIAGTILSAIALVLAVAIALGAPLSLRRIVRHGSHSVASAPDQATRAPTAADLAAKLNQIQGTWQPTSSTPIELLPTMKASQSTPDQDGTILISPGGKLTTNRSFRPPFALRMTLLSDGQDTRLAYGPTGIIFNWEMHRDELRVDGGPPNGRHKPGAGALPVNQWAGIEMIVDNNQMTLFVDGVERYRTQADFAKSNGRFSIIAHGGRVRVHSIAVAGHATD